MKRRTPRPVGVIIKESTIEFKKNKVVLEDIVGEDAARPRAQKIIEKKSFAWD